MKFNQCNRKVRLCSGVSGLSTVLMFTLLFLTARNVSALTIDLNSIDSGNAFPGVTSGGNPVIAEDAPTSNTSGTGNLSGIFTAAAKWWELVIKDPFTLKINFGWGALGGGTRGSHTLVNQADSDGGGPLPNRETEGTIRIDSDASNALFLDSTPHQNEEFGILKAVQGNPGDSPNGDIDVGRYFDATPGGDADGFGDVLSIVKHEIGHALGISSANNSFTPGSTLEINGYSIVTDGAHIKDFGRALLFSTVGTSRRTIQSEIDILAVASISDWSDLDLNVSHVPVPSAFYLFGSGLLGLIGIAKRKAA